MDIKQQIKKYLSNENTSLTNVVDILNSIKPIDQKTTVQNISNKLTRGTIKYNEVEEIANVLGYDITWQKQGNNGFSQTGVNYTKIKENPRNVLIEQEVHKFYTKLLTLLINYDFVYNVEEYIKRNLSVISINFNSLPLHSFIFSHSNFLCEALSYTPYGNEFIPMITYLNNVYYQGGIAILQEHDKQNLINSFEYFYDKYFSNNNNPQKDLLRRVDIYNEYDKKD